LRKLTYAIAAAGVLTVTAALLWAQDAVKVDSKHYKVEFENDQVRVLRIQYPAGEKSVMHEHPDSVAVFLTDHEVKFTDATASPKKLKPKPANAGGRLVENTCPRILATSGSNRSWSS